MKSNASDHMELLHAVYEDACSKCIAEVSDLRDLKTMRSRVENEGLSFLTITLPNFSRDFERSLAIGQIDPTLFQGFRKSGAIPAFLQGMLGRIFNRETGRILDNDEDTPTVVEAVRQVCLFYKKVQLPCTPARDAAAVERFVEVEQINSHFAASEQLLQDFRDVAFMLWNRMLAVLRLDALVPRHGPGATVERISGNQKYAWREWYDRLEPYFPLLDTAYSSSAHNAEELKQVTIVPAQEERPVRVTLVPKTLKTPRIIAIEPVCMQYTQQSLQSALYELIETDELSAGHVNFRDQSINQSLALSASRSGRLATIDLSDASDRVLRSIALSMFDCVPDIRDAIDACRSRSAVLPDGRIVHLEKFASMGSALCFPVEAMYFFTLCVLARLKKHNLPVSRENCYLVSRDVYVYGDDLIVPADDAMEVCDYLSKYNCKVNDAKSFWTGKFRESCGVDAYNGYEVTPVYLRRERPTDLQSVEELASWVATANLFYQKGYWRTASLMYCICERILGPLPYVSPESSILGRVSFLGYRTVEKWSDDLLPTHQLHGCQTFVQRGWKIQEVYSSDRIDGYPALQKCLLSLERRARGVEDASDWGLRRMASTIVTDPLHLERTARRGAVVLRRRWVSST